MKKLTTLTIAILLIAGAFLSSCKKESTTTEQTTSTDILVGKWYTKKYVEVYYNPNGVKGGESSSVDFNSTDFINFKANGDYENSGGISKFTHVGDKVTVTGKVNKVYTVKVLTATDLQLFSTSTDSQNYKYEVTLTLQK